VLQKRIIKKWVTKEITKKSGILCPNFAKLAFKGTKSTLGNCNFTHVVEKRKMWTFLCTHKNLRGI